MAKRLAGILSVFSFACVCLLGAVQSKAAPAVLVQALVALFVFYGLGRAVGAVAGGVLREHFEAAQIRSETEVSTPFEAPTEEQDKPAEAS